MGIQSLVAFGPSLRQYDTCLDSFPRPTSSARIAPLDSGERNANKAAGLHLLAGSFLQTALQLGIRPFAKYG